MDFHELLTKPNTSSRLSVRCSSWSTLTFLARSCRTGSSRKRTWATESMMCPTPLGNESKTFMIKQSQSLSTMQILESLGPSTLIVMLPKFIMTWKMPSCHKQCLWLGQRPLGSHRLDRTLPIGPICASSTSQSSCRAKGCEARATKRSLWPWSMLCQRRLHQELFLRASRRTSSRPSSSLEIAKHPQMCSCSTAHKTFVKREWMKLDRKQKVMFHQPSFHRRSRSITNKRRHLSHSFKRIPTVCK